MTSALTLPVGSQLASSWPEAPSGSQPLPFELDHLLALRVPGLIATRRHIHSHPELSGEEFETAALIARELSLAGLNPRLLPKGNGVICDIDGRPDGPVIALRADIDALPLTDPKDVPYRSTVDGVCHACGHDVHTSVMLGVGMLLAQLADLGQLDGRIRLIFQPAEEILPCGSLEVIEAGGLDDVVQIFAVHCDPNLPVGKVGLRVGPITAAADNVTVRLTGPGGHTARPHLTVDLVDALGRLVTEVPTLVSRRVPANSGLLLVFGHASAGTRYNVIPSEACAAGTLRVMDRDTWEQAPKIVAQVVRDVLAPTGATVDLEYLRGRPPVSNDARAIGVLTAATAAALGPEGIAETPQSMGGEDFSWYLEHVPGALARLGVGRAGPNVDLHRASFDVDERAIPVGVRLMVQTALRALAAAR
ncbi:amidohydrolase [Micromonospora globispora]|uniref:Amidohydrolase n=1 Tax=Micromonospora globispora TaxID=1450148 RepID=A0A317KJ05_9ACTN|nr:amidohydrolase [Micromonospora globispora]PWU51190.1 amidohydrolase [Micromonospora globispora]PWU53535.1 amidohydrolase [Micromonospora globispora]RQW97849.1 amidohydrolase [Micromonospora globispora]